MAQERRKAQQPAEGDPAGGETDDADARRRARDAEEAEARGDDDATPEGSVAPEKHGGAAGGPVGPRRGDHPESHEATEPPAEEVLPEGAHPPATPDAAPEP